MSSSSTSSLSVARSTEATSHAQAHSYDSCAPIAGLKTTGGRSEADITPSLVVIKGPESGDYVSLSSDGKSF